MYNNLLLISKERIPETRLISYAQFKSSGTKTNIENYIIHFLEINPNTLFTNRDISVLSGIEIGSLTLPLNRLKKANKIDSSGRKKNTTSKVAIAYKHIPKSSIEVGTLFSPSILIGKTSQYRYASHSPKSVDND